MIWPSILSTPTPTSSMPATACSACARRWPWPTRPRPPTRSCSRTRCRAGPSCWLVASSPSPPTSPSMVAAASRSMRTSESRGLLVESGTEGDPTDVSLAHLTITGGRTTGTYDGGGGIRADGYDAVTLDNTTVSGNSTAGRIRQMVAGSTAHYVTLTNSTVSGNSTAGDFAGGGGICRLRHADQQHRQRQQHDGRSASGGGISGRRTLTNSTVSDNSTVGVRRRWRDRRQRATLTNSTVSGNSTTGVDASGGGISRLRDAGQQHGQRQQDGR